MSSAQPAGGPWHIDHDAMSWGATGAIDRKGRWIGSPHCTSHDPIFWRPGYGCSVCGATTDLRPWDERRFICDRCTRENPSGLPLHEDGRIDECSPGVRRAAADLAARQIAGGTMRAPIVDFRPSLDRPARSRRGGPPPGYNAARDADIYRGHLAGGTRAELARRHNLSQERIKQIIREQRTRRAG